MLKHPQRFWLVALVVAWAVDILFWDKPIGISFLIFTLLAVAGGFGLAFSEQKLPARLSYLLGGMVILMAGVTVFRGEALTRGLNGFLAVGGLLLLVMTLRSGGWIRLGLLDYMVAGLGLFVTSFFRAAGISLVPKDADGSGGKSALRRLFPVLRGLLLALPVVGVLAALLASADLVFADQIDNLLINFNLEKIPEYLFRMFYILVLAYVFAGYYAQAVLPTRWGSSQPEDLQNGDDVQAVFPTPMTVKRFMGSTEAFVVLISVNLLFAFFVAIQFRYLFGGRANITAAGYTFAEYARRGFFELVWVAVITLLLFLVLNSITRRETPGQGRAFTGLSVLVVALVLVILVSALSRLLLYEDAYGFTLLRTYTHLFIPWLGFLLLATIVLEILRRERYFGALLLLTSFGFAMTLGFFNIEQFIVQQNVARARAGMELDGAYLLTLTDDSLPALAAEFQRPEQPQEVRDVLGAVLSCRLYKLADETPQPWQSYHPGSAAARQVYNNLDLTAYPIKMVNYGPAAMIDQTPYPCVEDRSAEQMD